MSVWSGRNSHTSGESRQAGAEPVTMGAEPWEPRMSFVPRASSLVLADLLPELCCSPICLPWAVLRQHLLAAVPPHLRYDSAPVQSTATCRGWCLRTRICPATSQLINALTANWCLDGSHRALVPWCEARSVSGHKPCALNQPHLPAEPLGRPRRCQQSLLSLGELGCGRA